MTLIPVFNNRLLLLNIFFLGKFHGSNPNSARFSPFTFTPRDCLGKNFAQMEMRTILANVFHRFNLELSEPYMDENVQKNGGLENFAATMGPMDLTPEGT